MSEQDVHTHDDSTQLTESTKQIAKSAHLQFNIKTTPKREVSLYHSQ